MDAGRVPFAAWPAEPAAWIALGGSIAALAAPLVLVTARRWGMRRAVLVCSIAAALLSAIYVHFYLRGGPRIIDATSYYLEARAMAEGVLTWPALSPSASFRGRFLLARWSAETATLGVIFPPGYPAVLALGFVAGAPMAVGPLIALLLVIATAALARAVSGRDETAIVAALMSSLCAALRYHTADTMSHGVAALALTVALAAAMHGRSMRAGSVRAAWMAAAGFALAWLVATRPISGAAAAVSIAPFALLPRGQRSLRDLAWTAAGAAAPLVLLGMHQAATTGSLLVSSQRAYYALADGPAGCFRYGFGEGVGCMVEHGTYVRDLLPNGFGLLEALRVTGRRLVLHVEDVLNLPMAIVLVPLGAWAGWGSRRTRVLAVVVAGQVLAYAPFYFDGNYPGAGARFFADAIPSEHVLAALAVVWWTDRIRGELKLGWGAAVTSSLMLAGFALFNAPKHAALRDRDGGRPFFEPGVVRAAGVRTGLLFVDSDHGFNTGFDPSVRDARAGLVVARARHDDHDRLLWARLNRPEAWSYRWVPWDKSPAPPSLDAWRPRTESDDEWVFEGEAEWPPLDQRGGYAAPTWLAPGSCVSKGVALAVVREGAERSCVTIELPFPGEGRWRVTPQLILEGRPAVDAWVDVGSERRRWELPASIDVTRWQGAAVSPSDGRWCVELPALGVEAGGHRSGTATVCTDAAWSAIDKVTLRR